MTYESDMNYDTVCFQVSLMNGLIIPISTMYSEVIIVNMLVLTYSYYFNFQKYQLYSVIVENKL